MSEKLSEGTERRKKKLSAKKKKKIKRTPFQTKNNNKIHKWKQTKESKQA